MAKIEDASAMPLAFKQSLEDCPLDAGQANCPSLRLDGLDAGKLLLTAAVCWGPAPLLVMGFLLAGEATRLVRDTLGMAGPGGDL